MRKIRECVRKGSLGSQFSVGQVNQALGIWWAGTFLAKHCEDNPGGASERFVRVARGVYRLKP
jgi:hypothetical protein